jgi:hypothetical protein
MPVICRSRVELGFRACVQKSGPRVDIRHGGKVRVILIKKTSLDQIWEESDDSFDRVNDMRNDYYRARLIDLMQLGQLWHKQELDRQEGPTGSNANANWFPETYCGSLDLSVPTRWALGSEDDG